MKFKMYLAVFLLIATTALTNAQELPKQGVALKMNETSFNLTPGTTTETQIKLLRSKRAKKTKFDGLEARTSQDLTISFVKDDSEVDTYKMTIAVAQDAAVKPHTIIVKGLGVNSSKLKGKAISVNVLAPQMV